MRTIARYLPFDPPAVCPYEDCKTELITYNRNETESLTFCPGCGAHRFKQPEEDIRLLMSLSEVTRQMNQAAQLYGENAPVKKISLDKPKEGDRLGITKLPDGSIRITDF